MIEATDYFEDRVIDLGGLRTGRSETIHTEHSRDGFIQFYKAGGGNDVMVVEANLAGDDDNDANWDNADVNNATFALIAAGITLYRWEGLFPPYISFRKVSGNAQITIQVYIGGVS